MRQILHEILSSLLICCLLLFLKRAQDAVLNLSPEVTNMGRGEKYFKGVKEECPFSVSFTLFLSAKAGRSLSDGMTGAIKHLPARHVGELGAWLYQPVPSARSAAYQDCAWQLGRYI